MFVVLGKIVKRQKKIIIKKPKRKMIMLYILPMSSEPNQKVTGMRWDQRF